MQEKKKRKRSNGNSKPSTRSYWFRETTVVVIYLRVSSEEQARDANGIESQLSECELYCKRRGWTIGKVFKDAPASGWSGADRPQFKEMLQYLHANRNANLVFFDYSRFYRRAALAILEFEKLDQAGIYSVSVCNSTVDCRTAGGRTERRRLLNEAEDFSDSHSEKQRGRMRAAVVDRHRFIGVGGLGYLNVRAAKGRPNIVPNEPAFSLMNAAFLLMDSGTMRPTDCLREMAKRGLRSKHGNEITVGGFIRMLQNPVYCGKIPSKKWGVQPGIHQACVSEAVFNRVQLILRGKKPVTAPHKRNREELPLRQFLICPGCGHRLTGGKVPQKKYGYTYWYYWCPTKGCRAVSVRNDRVHEEFVDLLASLRFDAPLRESFVVSLKEKWDLKHGESATVVSRLSSQLSKEKDRRRNLLFKHVDNDPLIANEFPELKASLDSSIESLEIQIQESTMARATFDDLLTFTMKLPQNLGKIWETLPVDLKQKVQNTLFPGGLKCDPKKGILNEDSQCVFNQLRGFLHGNVYMVDAVGIEPTTCRLRAECSAS